MADSRQEALEYCLKRTPQRIAQVKAAVQLIQERTQRENHDVLVVLGSGLHDTVCNLGKNPVELPLKELLGAKIPSAQGHGTQIVSVQIETEAKTVNILVCTGRIHLYEGHTPADLCFVPQVAAMTGIQAAFLTNAGGCLQPWELGDVMAIRDHINFSGASPFTGPVFVDISQVWDSDLTAAIKKHASRSGVYAISRGPEYQTLAESIMMRNNGIDMVGMSTVLEAIALHQLGVRVCGVSVTSDLTFSSTPTTHSEVLHAVKSAIPCVQNCLYEVINALY